MEDTREIDMLIAKLRDVFPFPKEKDWDNGYDWNKKDGWHLAGITKDPKDCLEIMIGVCEGMKADTGEKQCNLPVVNACAPNREFKGTLKTYSGFTQSNRNILQIEVAGVENYIGNTLKVGDEVNIQHWR